MFGTLRSPMCADPRLGKEHPDTQQTEKKISEISNLQKQSPAQSLIRRSASQLTCKLSQLNLGWRKMAPTTEPWKLLAHGRSFCSQLKLVRPISPKSSFPRQTLLKCVKISLLVRVFNLAALTELQLQAAQQSCDF